jgi:hypothetical protein
MKYVAILLSLLGIISLFALLIMDGFLYEAAALCSAIGLVWAFWNWVSDDPYC